LVNFIASVKVRNSSLLLGWREVLSNVDLLRGYQVSPGRSAISDGAMSLLVNKDPVLVDLEGVSSAIASPGEPIIDLE